MEELESFQERNFQERKEQIEWMFDKVSTNPMLVRIFQSSFISQLSAFVSSIRDSMKTQIKTEIKKGLEGKDGIALIELLSTSEWGFNFLEDLSLVLVQNCYYWRFKERFPEFYSQYLETLAQSALTTKTVVENKFRLTETLLALYDHEYFLNHTPMLLRIARPYSFGTSNRGKKPKIPQEDMALFVYNGREIEQGSSSALVYHDGDFHVYDTNATRITLVKKSKIIKKALHSGFYQTKGGVLPIIGVTPFWQRRFVGFLEYQRSFLRRLAEDQLDVDCSPDEREEVHNIADALILGSKRFIADRQTFKEYWEGFLEVPEYKRILLHPEFKIFYSQQFSNSKEGPKWDEIIKVMTILD